MSAPAAKGVYCTCASAAGLPRLSLLTNPPMEIPAGQNDRNSSSLGERVDEVERIRCSPRGGNQIRLLELPIYDQLRPSPEVSTRVAPGCARPIS